jgi:hypothetical protein
MQAPHAQYVGQRDPVEVLRESLDAYVSLTTLAGHGVHHLQQIAAVS